MHAAARTRPPRRSTGAGWGVSGRVLAVLSVLAALAGCAHRLPVDDLFDDAAFGPPAEPVDVAAVFALDDAMRRYLDEQLRPAIGRRDPRDALAEVLYRPGELRLDYDSTRTRTAAEAFAARAGNCLSLVVMSAAFAKALDLPVRFHVVSVPEAWSREGDLQFASRHVNLSLDAPPRASRLDATRVLTIDFLPSEALRRQRARDIPERTVLAMYLNNRAAEALSAGDLDTAYAFAREALQRDPDFLVAHNTLAVVYLRHGDVVRAGRVLEGVLAREPGQRQALANLVVVKQRAGDAAGAEAAARRLAALEPLAPFQHLDRGIAALRGGDAAGARRLFEQQLALDPDYHETHFWLAAALARLGEASAAAEHLQRALDASSSAATRQRYAAKLELLRRTLH